MEETQTREVFGIFDGDDTLVAEDGRNYPVPANYISKSKLIPGDKLKVTIPDSGDIFFKQVALAKRKNIISVCQHAENKDGDIINPELFIVTDEGSFCIHRATKTFFQLEAGDEVLAVIPAEGGTTCAIEGVVRRKNPETLDKKKTVR